MLWKIAKTRLAVRACGVEMEHREYIERYLLSDLGTTLDQSMKATLADHFAGCAECRQELAEERAAKAILKAKVPIIRAPDSLRSRIGAALDNSEIAELSARAPKLGRATIWVASAALAACVIVLLVNLLTRQASLSVFDGAIASYLQSEQSFTPTAGTGSNDALALAMINEFGVPMVWDFSSLGLSPVGGRIDHSAYGRAIAYSMYKGNRGSLLSIVGRNHTFHFPPGGQVVKGIHIYRYNGFTVAATNKYAVFCIMVTRIPAGDLANAFDSLPA